MNPLSPQLVIRPITMTDLWIQAGPLSINIVAGKDSVTAEIHPTYGDDDGDDLPFATATAPYLAGRNRLWYEKDENPG